MKRFTLDENEIQDVEKPMKLLCRETIEKEVQEYFGSYGTYKNKESGYISVTAPQIAGPQFFWMAHCNGKGYHDRQAKENGSGSRDYLKLLAKEYKGI